MPSRSRLRVVVRRWERLLPVVIAVSVFVGLVASGLVNLWIETPDADGLQGVALGAQALLVAERSVAFFAIWLLMLVVSAQALKGRLPIEVSGRGVRYAEAPKSQSVTVDAGAALEQLALDVAAQRREPGHLQRDFARKVG